MPQIDGRDAFMCLGLLRLSLVRILGTRLVGRSSQRIDVWSVMQRVGSLNQTQDSVLKFNSLQPAGTQTHVNPSTRITEDLSVWMEEL